MEYHYLKQNYSQSNITNLIDWEDDLFALHTYIKSRKKHDYMVNTKRSKLLDSFFFENQVWDALHKSWKGYVIAKNKDEYDKMELYARRIQE